jgi:hypothetical protein
MKQTRDTQFSIHFGVFVTTTFQKFKKKNLHQETLTYKNIIYLLKNFEKVVDGTKTQFGSLFISDSAYPDSELGSVYQSALQV